MASSKKPSSWEDLFLEPKPGPSKPATEAKADDSWDDLFLTASAAPQKDYRKEFDQLNESLQSLDLSISSPVSVKKDSAQRRRLEGLDLGRCEDLPLKERVRLRMLGKEKEEDIEKLLLKAKQASQELEEQRLVDEKQTGDGCIYACGDRRNHAGEEGNRRFCGLAYYTHGMKNVDRLTGIGEREEWFDGYNKADESIITGCIGNVPKRPSSYAKNVYQNSSYNSNSVGQFSLGFNFSDSVVGCEERVEEGRVDKETTRKSRSKSHRSVSPCDNETSVEEIRQTAAINESFKRGLNSIMDVSSNLNADTSFQEASRPIPRPSKRDAEISLEMGCSPIITGTLHRAALNPANNRPGNITANCYHKGDQAKESDLCEVATCVPNTDLRGTPGLINCYPGGSKGTKQQRSLQAGTSKNPSCIQVSDDETFPITNQTLRDGSTWTQPNDISRFTDRGEIPDYPINASFDTFDSRVPLWSNSASNCHQSSTCLEENSSADTSTTWVNGHSSIHKRQNGVFNVGPSNALLAPNSSFPKHVCDQSTLLLAPARTNTMFLRDQSTILLPGPSANTIPINEAPTVLLTPDSPEVTTSICEAPTVLIPPASVSTMNICEAPTVLLAPDSSASTMHISEAQAPTALTSPYTSSNNEPRCDQTTILLAPYSPTNGGPLSEASTFLMPASNSSASYLCDQTSVVVAQDSSIGRPTSQGGDDLNSASPDSTVRQRTSDEPTILLASDAPREFRQTFDITNDISGENSSMPLFINPETDAVAAAAAADQAIQQSTMDNDYVVTEEQGTVNNMNQHNDFDEDDGESVSEDESFHSSDILSVVDDRPASETDGIDSPRHQERPDIVNTSDSEDVLVIIYETDTEADIDEDESNEENENNEEDGQSDGQQSDEVEYEIDDFEIEANDNGNNAGAIIELNRDGVPPAYTAGMLAECLSLEDSSSTLFVDDRSSFVVGGNFNVHKKKATAVLNNCDVKIAGDVTSTCTDMRLYSFNDSETIIHGDVQVRDGRLSFQEYGSCKMVVGGDWQSRNNDSSIFVGDNSALQIDGHMCSESDQSTVVISDGSIVAIGGDMSARNDHETVIIDEGSTLCVAGDFATIDESSDLICQDESILLVGGSITGQNGTTRMCCNEKSDVRVTGGFNIENSASLLAVRDGGRVIVDGSLDVTAKEFSVRIEDDSEVVLREDLTTTDSIAVKIDVLDGSVLTVGRDMYIQDDKKSEISVRNGSSLVVSRNVFLQDTYKEERYVTGSEQDRNYNDTWVTEDARSMLASELSQTDQATYNSTEHMSGTEDGSEIQPEDGLDEESDGGEDDVMTDSQGDEAGSDEAESVEGQSAEAENGDCQDEAESYEDETTEVGSDEAETDDGQGDEAETDDGQDDEAETDDGQDDEAETDDGQDDEAESDESQSEADEGQAKGEAESDEGQGEADSDEGQGEAESDESQGEAESDEGQGEAESDESQGEAESNEGQGEADRSNKGQGEAESNEGRGEAESDEGQGSEAESYAAETNEGQGNDTQISDQFDEHQSDYGQSNGQHDPRQNYEDQGDKSDLESKDIMCGKKQKPLFRGGCPDLSEYITLQNAAEIALCLSMLESEESYSGEEAKQPCNSCVSVNSSEHENTMKLVEDSSLGKYRLMIKTTSNQPMLSTPKGIMHASGKEIRPVDVKQTVQSVSNVEIRPTADTRPNAEIKPNVQGGQVDKWRERIKDCVNGDSDYDGDDDDDDDDAEPAKHCYNLRRRNCYVTNKQYNLRERKRKVTRPVYNTRTSKIS